MELGDEFGPYRIDARLGSGGMGVVYKATDRRVPRTVALKILTASFAADPHYRERFRRESAVLSSAEHPHIVPMYGAGEIDGRLYLDMRFIDGEDLQTRLGQSGPLPVRRAATLIEGLADALDFVHSRGIMHRDIKPSNIVLSGARQFPYLLDFGIARTDDEAGGLTQANTVVGSLEYLAPERFEGAPADRASDIYALTGVLLAAVTGRPPYAGCNELVRAVRAHCFDPVPRASALDPALAPLDEVIATGMAKDPARRFDTAEHLAQAAADALDKVRRTTAAATTETMGQRTPPPLPVPPASAAPNTTPPAAIPRAPTVTATPARADFGAPTFTRTAVPPSPAASPQAPPPPTWQHAQPAPRTPAVLRWTLVLGVLAFAILLTVSLFRPVLHVEHGLDTRFAHQPRSVIASLAVPVVLGVAVALFALGLDRLYEFAVGLVAAAAVYVPAYALNQTRRVYLDSSPAGSGYKLTIAALVVGVLVGLFALWSPGRRMLRGRARFWPVVVLVAAAVLAGELIAFKSAHAYRSSTEWAIDKWSIGFTCLAAVTVVAALYVLGGRRIVLGMIAALFWYSAVRDLVRLTYPHAGLFPKLELVADAVLVAIALFGWRTLPREPHRVPADGALTRASRV